MDKCNVFFCLMNCIKFVGKFKEFCGI